MSSEGTEPTEEELRAASEPELKRLRVEHVLLDNVGALANLGMRRTGLAPGTEGERDPDQVRVAGVSIRAPLPVLQGGAPTQRGAILDAVSQLQLAFVRIGGHAPAPAGAAGGEGPPAQAPPTQGPAGQLRPDQPPTEAEAPKPGEPGPAQRSGRLWIPGQ